MIYLAWKVLVTLSRFRWWDGYTSQKNLSLIFCFELWHLYKSLLPSAKGLSFTLCNFYFWMWVSIFSYKAPTKGHYDRTWVLGVANMRVCFMNGSMIEHYGLGITYFSVDILKYMVACWYVWVFKSHLKLDDCFEPYKSPNVHATKKTICDEHVRQHCTSKILFLSFTYSRTSRN